ncbi:hypothetical protein [Allobranchiibius sp. CTAmp26]|uniref:hypothetical protein n=1 Tax=Allobranchiibius sp. CTAmp26 TaxID=2815214 RepID=UPI001AA113EB|nr:hypothetical protein [Allobranchiibius sp. CTAmp26]MBO1755624.1 hypothetical protein [Allobranchiibius sp. CTAmp26]
MHPDNHRFGHAQILAVYVNPDHERLDPWSPPSIRGRLQPEWDLTTRWERPADAQDSLPVFVWSDVARRRRLASGRSSGFALGAPWAYLQTLDRDAFRSEEELTLREEEPPAPVVPRGTLFLPSHGIQGQHLARRLATHLRRTCGSVTVGLSPADEAVPALRAAYTDLGHEVVPLGRTQDDPGTDEPRRLVRLRDLFARHKRVAANAPRAELLFAAATRLPVALEGPAVGEQDPVLTDLGRRLAALDETGWREYADRELGIAHVVPPDELRTLLDWNRHD